MHLLFLIHVQVHFIEGKEVEGPPSHRHINTIKKETKVGGGRWRLKCSSTKNQDLMLWKNGSKRNSELSSVQNLSEITRNQPSDQPQQQIVETIGVHRRPVLVVGGHIDRGQELEDTED